MTRRGTTNANSRGGSVDRHRRKLWLLAEFGDGEKAPCSFCGAQLDYHSITVDRFPLAGCDGGTYKRGNIRPACSPCNSHHGGKLAAARRKALTK